MLCPICSAPLHELEIDMQHVHHCVKCGSTLFEEGGINRITGTSATYLGDNITDAVSFTEPAVKSCPRDQEVLVALVNQEAIPSHVQLLTCLKCHLVLAKAQDLIDFKKAQDAKINYIKSWRFPMGSLRSVFAVLAMALMSVFGYLSFSAINREASLQTQAARVVINAQVVATGRLVIVSFRTEDAVLSELIITDPAGMAPIAVSQKPSTIHTASFSRPSHASVIRYRIRLTNQQGDVAMSDEVTASVKKN